MSISTMNVPSGGSQPTWPAAVLKRARCLHQELIDLHQQIDTTFLEVGARLKEIRDRDLYEPLHFPSFTSYLKSLEFSRSRAYALIGVVEDFYLSSRLDKSDLLAIGWEKLSLLRLVKGSEAFGLWLAKSQQLGKRQLRREMGQAGLLPAASKAVVEGVASDETDAEAPSVEAAPKPEVVYLAVKKLTAIKWLRAEEVEAAKASGTYPLIVGVVGSAHAQNGAASSLPHLTIDHNLPMLEPEAESEEVPL